MVMARVAEAAARAGVPGSAEQAARSITRPDEQARALAGAAEAAARAGDPGRAGALAAAAEQAARSVTDPYLQARALARVAGVAEPATARSCIAGALAVWSWSTPLEVLARVDPVALSAFADELAAAAAPSGPLDNGLLSGHQRDGTPGGQPP